QLNSNIYSHVDLLFFCSKTRLKSCFSGPYAPSITGERRGQHSSLEQAPAHCQDAQANGGKGGEREDRHVPPEQVRGAVKDGHLQSVRSVGQRVEHGDGLEPIRLER